MAHSASASLQFINGIMMSMYSFVFGFSFFIEFLRFIYLSWVAIVCSLYCWVVFCYSYIIIVHSVVDGQLGYFQFLSFLNKAAINIFVQIFWWTYTLISPGYIDIYSGVVLLNHSWMFSSRKNCQIVFQRLCQFTLSPTMIWVPLVSPPHQYLLFFN